MGSSLSNIVEVTLSPIIAPPVLRGVLGGQPPGAEIFLSWTCATSAITSFILWKSANNGPFLEYQTFPGTQFSFTDQILDDPTDDLDQAAYYLIATKGSGLSGPSNEVTNGAGI